VQVAISLVLVVGAGLLARSLANAQRVDPGVDAERIALLATNLTLGGVATDAAASVTEEILQRIAGLPGVERVALTTRAPLQSGGTTTQVVEGYEPPSGTGSVELAFAIVSGSYFETMGIPVIAGRTFTEDDRAGGPRVMLVSETAARVFWGGDALGKRIRSQGSETWREVVGVVGDVKVRSVQEPPTPMAYFPARQSAATSFSIVARTAGEPASIAAGMQGALREVRPTLPVVRLAPLEDLMGVTLAGPRAAAAFMGAFSLLALLLASLGVYAMVSFAVQLRGPELGIRAALGAGASNLMRAVVGESLIMTAFGVTAGLILAAIATRGLRTLLFGVSAADAATFTGGALLLFLSAGVAAFIPALRAARTDPAEVLKSQ
jgi:putative ABC transport system permease protein